MTVCRTLTLPGFPFASGSALLGEKLALHGAPLSGVLEYGEAPTFAFGENGEVGICSRFGVREDRGWPGLANCACGDGGMTIRGDSGRILALTGGSIFDAAVCSAVYSETDVFEDEVERFDS